MSRKEEEWATLAATTKAEPRQPLIRIGTNEGGQYSQSVEPSRARQGGALQALASAPAGAAEITWSSWGHLSVHDISGEAKYFKKLDAVSWTRALRSTHRSAPWTRAPARAMRRVIAQSRIRNDAPRQVRVTGVRPHIVVPRRDDAVTHLA